MTVTAGASGSPGAAKARRRRREAGLGFLLIAPALVIFSVFVFFPFAKNFELALYRNPPFPGLPSKFVGLQQIGDVLGSSDFRHSLWVTVLFALLTVPAGILLGLLLAQLANQRLRGMAIYRTIFASTVATSVAVASVIFGTLMNPQVGLLPWLGIHPTPAILDNPTWALPAVALATIWQTLGLSFILMSAGLQAVPEDVLEAAQVDGASAPMRFWRVTIPLLSPTIFFTAVVGSIFAFQTFGQIDLLTRGGPQNKTNVLTYFIVTELHDHQNPGTAAVLSIALFLITLALTLLQLRFLERRVHYAR
ncbi:MAG TPA: sugar ABC transporter permease [Acidimicrobiia bacterium]|nr:sugar ABC transporter permease [Acidimicrobiia bacterium]